MVRAPFVDKDGLTKGAWSKEEDAKLRDYIQKFGHWNWKELPKHAGLSRCGKSCRLRWMNYLRPDVKHGKYTMEEEDLILDLHMQLGNKWSIISSKLPGRTDNEIKNYWHTHLKKRAKTNRNRNASSLQEQVRTKTGLNNEVSNEEKAESVAMTFTPPNPILESCPFSPETTSSSTDFSHLSSTEFTLVSSEFGSNTVTSNIADQESVTTLFELSDESSGDFWTEPFISDNFIYKQDKVSMLSAASMYDDSTDLFYQVMQELQGI